MLLSGAWFEIIAATLLAILVLAIGCRPPWCFWTRNCSAKTGKSSLQSLQELYPRTFNPWAISVIAIARNLLFLSFFPLSFLSSMLFTNARYQLRDRFPIDKSL
jgi:hypothetical protein